MLVARKLSRRVSFHIFGILDMQVMIFDFDVHHGNGTNDTFYEDPSVLFVSVHQGGSYPGRI